MVKASNKGKGAPSKRTNFKTKYKIERKVKQHRKKMKKQAKKLQGSGLKHKRVSKSEFMPNMFPFKQQILQQLKSTLPKGQQTSIVQLNSQDFNLVSLENKPHYFPKPKDNLIKKYVRNIDKVFETCNVILQVLEARAPTLSINPQFRKLCKSKGVKRIVVVCKSDTVKPAKLDLQINELKKNGDIILKFTTDSKHRVQFIEEIRKSIKEAVGTEKAMICIAGKANTGKHTLLTNLCKHAGKYQIGGCQLFEIAIGDDVKIIDAPYNLQDSTQFPLFFAPNPLKQEESLIAQEESVLKLLFFEGDKTFQGPILNRNNVLIHYEIQDFTSVDDFIKKVGKANRIFGKGGMIDAAIVRSRILTDWYSGKLNNLVNDV